MSDKDAIRSMVQNLIKSNESEAEMDIHPVFTNKIKQLASINNDSNTSGDDNEYPEIDNENDEDE